MARYKTITSPSNPLVREAVRIKERKKRSDRLLLEGHRLIEMAADAGAEIHRVFFTGDFRSRNERFLRRLSKKSELIESTGHILSKLSDTETPQGIIAISSYRPFDLEALPLKENPLIVVCDSIQDPGNLGTLIRVSDAAGADAVIILPGTCDPFMPKVIRSTAGSIFNMPLLFSGPDLLAEWLRGKGIGLFVTDVKAKKTIFEADLRKPSAIVFGNEASGVSEDLKVKADMLLNIPILGKAESLNVATSAAICLYEAVRQRRGR